MLIFRGVVVYLVLFALLRFIGKKHVGELSPFDLVVLLIISETVDASLIGDDHSLTGGLISAATLVVVVQIVGYLTWRFKKVGRAGRRRSTYSGPAWGGEQRDYEQ